MPLSRLIRDEANVGLFPGSAPGAKPEAAFRDAQAFGLVAALKELAALAAAADQIFAGLVAESATANDRLSSLTQRVAALDGSSSSSSSAGSDKHRGTLGQAMARLEAASVDSALGVPRAEFSAPAPQAAMLFTAKTRPERVVTPHTAARPPPDLDALTPLRDDDESCLALYTNPSFFLDHWIEEQGKLRAAAKVERKRRRAERIALRQQQDAGKERNNLGPKKPRKLVREVYDPNTGEKIVVEVDEGSSDAAGSASSSASSFPAAATAQSTMGAMKGDIDLDALAQQPATPTSSSSSSSSGHHKKSMRRSHKSRHGGGSSSHGSGSSGAVADDGSGAPPPPPPGAPAPPPPPGAPAPPPTSSSPAAPPPPDAPAPPPNAPAPPSAPAPPPAPNAPAPPPAPPAAPGAPPPPAVTPAAGGGAGGLLAGIAGGASGLRKAEVQEKPVDAHSGLLEGIRSGMALKKASERVVEKKEEDAPDNSVAAILSRRIAITGSSSSDDDEDDWDDWD